MTTKLAKWASEHDQIIKSRLSYGHQANPLHQKRGWPTIGSDLMVIWEMSVKTPARRRLTPRFGRIRVDDRIGRRAIGVRHTENVAQKTGRHDRQRVHGDLWVLQASR